MGGVWLTRVSLQRPDLCHPFDKLMASLESVYEEALAHEFDRRSIPYERQAKLSVHYKEIVAGEFRTDFPSTALRLRSGCSSGQD